MKEGYYWVKIRETYNWEIASWEYDVFNFIGSDVPYYREDVYQIGDYIDIPEAYKDTKLDNTSILKQ